MTVRLSTLPGGFRIVTDRMDAVETVSPAEARTSPMTVNEFVVA